VNASKTKTAEAAKRYPKIIEWVDADACYVGSAPPLIGRCCHSPTEAGVLAQLQVIAEEWAERLVADGKPLPVVTTRSIERVRKIQSRKIV